MLPVASSGTSAQACQVCSLLLGMPQGLQATQGGVQVSARIWHHAVEALADMNDVSSLVAWLPADQLGGKAGAAAALLANLAQVSGTALQVGTKPHGS